MSSRPIFFFSLTLAVCGAFAADPVTSVRPPGAPAELPATGYSPLPGAGVPAVPGPPAPPVVPPPSGVEEKLKPTWETQKLARTYVLGIPAPRGLIADRNGHPLAQTRVSYNLAIQFPTPLNFSDNGALAFAHAQIREAERILGRPAGVSDAQILKHYQNRGILPLDIAQDLLPAEVQGFKAHPPANLSLHPVYQRFYPNGFLAGHVIGYAGRAGRVPDGPIENNELLWPNAEGREGLEQTFNEQLTGCIGQMNMVFDAAGKKTSEKVVIPPQPGFHVITTLDENIQRLCEEALAKGAKRGAIVVIDPNNGDILAMASWPVFNPNAFIPAISAEAFKALQDDPDIPLLPRAFRSAYPPGSTFKVIVGLAALESETITREDEFSGPAEMKIGNLVMHNWKKTDAGMLNFHGALEQSCDTWFYQVGIKTGAKPIVEWALNCGFGAKTGIPLHSEAEGRVPTDEYMKKTHGRKLLDGDLANYSIGQGDLLVTPLQLAQAMAAIGNGGTLYQPRLVQQVQSIDSRVVTAYNVRIKRILGIRRDILAEIKSAMVDAVTGGNGTAHKARVEHVEVAGKTGTAQWGPKNKERNAAWFAGFAPADNPKYAFAALYEGEAGKSAHGGDYAAPMIGKVLNELFKEQAKPKKKKKGRTEEPPKPPEGDTNAD
jgi:penicillin-binding protein 2